MADSPLASMVPQQDEAPQVPQKTQSQDAISNILAMSKEQSRLSQKALDMRRDELLRLSQQRMFDPRLMKFAGAMFRPTKTGSFGESLGYGAEALADEEEKEMARQQAMAKLQYEIELESAKQRKSAAIPQLLMQMQQERNQPVMPSSPTAQPVQAAAQPAAQPTQATAQPQNKRARGARGLFPDVSEEQLVVMSMDPDLKPLVDTELKLREDRRKSAREVSFGTEKRFLYPEQIEEFQMLSDNNDMAGLEKFYRRQGVPFPYIKDPSHPSGYRIPTESEKKALEERERSRYGKQEPVWVYELGRNIPMSPLRASEYETARAEGKGKEWLQKNMPDAMPSGTSGEGRTGANLPPSETEKTAQVERAKEETKLDVEQGVNLLKEGTGAREKREIAKNLQSIAKSNSPIFNVMQDSSVSDALARTVKNGVSTPWGNISIDPTDLVGALNSYFESNPDLKITKNDRVAYSLFLQNIAKLVIQERRLSRGEGAISDKETNLFSQVNVLPTDSALGIRLKAELMIERANASEQLGQAFYKYRKETKGSYEDFVNDQNSPYRKIIEGYDKRLDRIRENNAQLLGRTESKAEQKPVAQTTLPPAAQKQLAEGQVTIFQNGQEWTLENGKPKRLK